MNVLIACEESQRVCAAFRKRGHEAFSCDIKECSGGHPEWHIRGDVLKIIDGHCVFITQDGKHHELHERWNLIIAHPPCTRLCSSGQRWLYFGSIEYQKEKQDKQKEAIEFFMAFVNAKCEKIAIENPIGIMSTIYRKPDCKYNPYDFAGETECKTTCLWLKGLPKLTPTRKVPLSPELRSHDIYRGHSNGIALSWSSEEIKVMRSKTPFGVAKAMAEQWG